MWMESILTLHPNQYVAGQLSKVVLYCPTSHSSGLPIESLPSWFPKQREAEKKRNVFSVSCRSRAPTTSQCTPQVSFPPQR